MRVRGDGDNTKRGAASEPDLPESYDSTIQVLDRARQGDRSAARVLIERAIPALRRWARGRLPSYSRGAADTEDIVNDAVLQTLRRIGAFEHRTVGALQAYLRESVLNRIRDAVRRVRRRGVPEELPDSLEAHEPSPMELAIQREHLDRFLEALHRLRPADRQLVVWRIELGYSYAEIAERVGKSKEAAAMSVRRALVRLSKELGVTESGR
jgi:RNA polymerase sigma factor (sigma-70 family)